MPSPNPFSPPNAHVADLPATGPGSPVKAIFLGLLVDIGGSILFASIFMAAYGASLAASGMSDKELLAAATNIPPGSWVFVTTAGIGLLFSILGGYTCARIARHSEYRNGLILATLTTLIGLITGFGQYSALLGALLGAAGFACVLVGTRVGRAKNATA